MVCTSHLGSIVIIVESRRIQWVENMVRMGETRNEYSILVRKTLGKVHLLDQKGDGSITLR
jgi:hypothetical protein